MKPFQNAFGSLQRVDGKSSANQSAELLITQRVEAVPGFDDCALRVDYQQQDDDAFAPPRRFIITSQQASSPPSGLEVKLALQRRLLFALALAPPIQAVWQTYCRPKFLSHWVKRHIPNPLMGSAEHHARPRDASRLDLPKVLMRDRESQSATASTRPKDLPPQKRQICLSPSPCFKTQLNLYPCAASRQNG